MTQKIKNLRQQIESAKRTDSLDELRKKFLNAPEGSSIESDALSDILKLREELDNAEETS